MSLRGHIYFKILNSGGVKNFYSSIVNNTCWKILVCTHSSSESIISEGFSFLVSRYSAQILEFVIFKCCSRFVKEFWICEGHEIHQTNFAGNNLLATVVVAGTVDFAQNFPVTQSCCFEDRQNVLPVWPRAKKYISSTQCISHWLTEKVRPRTYNIFMLK